MLTSEQIESLFTFCRKHYVYYYDVQVELVDHLANAIESEMESDPRISFEKALEKVHKSFGIMGFATVVAEKEKMVLKQGRKLFWSTIKEQFTWPEVLLFFSLSSILFSIFSLNLIPIRWCFLSVIIVGCYFVLSENLKFSRIISKTGKKFLSTVMSQSVTFMWMPLYFLYYPGMFDKDFLANVHSTLSLLFFSIFLSLFSIMVIAILQTFSSVKNNLYKSYPEVFPFIK